MTEASELEVMRMELQCAEAVVLEMQAALIECVVAIVPLTLLRPPSNEISPAMYARLSKAEQLVRNALLFAMEGQ